MVRLNVVLNHDNVEKVRALQNKVPNSLNPVSKMQLRIPSLGVVIEDSTPDAYPVKWSFTPADDGLIELQLGDTQQILDEFIISTTGDAKSGSQWITNVPDAAISKIKKYMSVDATPLGSVSEITSIRRRQNKIKLSVAAASTETGAALSIYEYVESSIHECRFYLYNVDYPDGVYWNKIELNIGF